MSRKSLGIVAVLLLVLGLIIAFRGPEDGSGKAFAWGCIRVGLVLGALWLAFPQIVAVFKKAPAWLLSWFLKPGKPGDNAPSTSESLPARREKRPRRRSQT